MKDYYWVKSMISDSVIWGRMFPKAFLQGCDSVVAWTALVVALARAAMSGGSSMRLGKQPSESESLDTSITSS